MLPIFALLAAIAARSQENVTILDAGLALPIWLEISASQDRQSDLIACGMLSQPDRGATGFVSVSHDGGRSWKQTLKVDDARFVSEQSCAAGRDGRMYFAASVGDGKSARTGRLRYYRSTDRGKTWNEPQTLPFADMFTMAVDDRNGRVYAVANGFRRLSDGKREHSLDLFRTAGPDAELQGPAREPAHPEFQWGGTFPGNAAVNDRHQIFGIYHTARIAPDAPLTGAEAFPRYVEVIRSDDLGRSWNPPKIVQPMDHWGLPDEPALVALRKDRLMAAWTSRVEGSPLIHLAVSNDAGGHWTNVPFSVPEAAKWAIQPHLAAFRSRGAVLSFFSLEHRRWYLCTLDKKGRLMSPAIAVSKPFTVEDAKRTYPVDRLRKTGLAANRAFAFPIWFEVEGGNNLVRTARVALRGSTPRN